MSSSVTVYGIQPFWRRSSVFLSRSFWHSSTRLSQAFRDCFDICNLLSALSTFLEALLTSSHAALLWIRACSIANWLSFLAFFSSNLSVNCRAVFFASVNLLMASCSEFSFLWTSLVASSVWEKDKSKRSFRAILSSTHWARCLRWTFKSMTGST